MGVISVLDMMKAGKLQEFTGILGYLVSSRPASDKILPPNLRKKKWGGGEVWGKKREKKGKEENKVLASFSLTGRKHVEWF